MKILVLDEFLSYPVDSGKKVRTYNLLRQMARHHTITLQTYVWGDPAEKVGLEHFRSLGIEVVAVPRRDPRKSGARFYWALFRNLFSPLPYIVDGHVSDRYAEALATTIARVRPDIALAEWSPYSVYLKPLAGIPRVAVAHNLESSIWRGYVEQAANPAKRAYARHQHRKVVAFEDEIFGWLDGLITVSPVELAHVAARYPRLNAVLVDNGVDTDYFSPATEEEDDNLIAFTGSMDWRPNQDAVQYFTTAILPELRRRAEAVTAVVVGRRPPEWLAALGRKHGVIFTGSVDDVRPWVRRAAVSIVPLRIGGGSRLKILEALAMKKAVVSTTLGAEGLDLKSGEHLLIADTPGEFAAAVAGLLADRARRRQLGEAGYRQVIRKYRWEELGSVQLRFLESLAHKPSGQAHG